MRKTKKTITILLCAVTMALMSSCSKEDNNQVGPSGGGTYQEKIVGKWGLIRQYGWWWEDEYTDDTFDPPKEYVIFDSDGTFTRNGFMFSYVITDNILQIEGYGVYEIKSLTSTVMTLCFDETRNVVFKKIGN